MQLLKLTVLTEAAGKVPTWIPPASIVSVQDTKEGTLVYMYLHPPVIIPPTMTIVGPTEGGISTGIDSLKVLESGGEINALLKKMDKEMWDDDE